MAISPVVFAQAKAQQHAAAQDQAALVRLVAGPGTGKSFSVGERVMTLRANGVPAAEIWAISFTRKAAEDLGKGIDSYAKQPTGIRVSTLHSLALSTLQAHGALNQFPVRPQILDNWEQDKIFDLEFQSTTGIAKRRCAEIRLHFEAVWSTGAPPAAHISKPNPAISAAEEASFRGFHQSRSQLYACMLPGEAVRRCVEEMAAGLLNPVALMNLSHLIVDEYQDLNPCDIEFIDRLAGQGASVFVAGDDDQSIYSFRFASPAGIQNFHTRHPGASLHTLVHCFRCAHDIHASSQAVLSATSAATRIPKPVQSVWTSSVPPVSGAVYRWLFQNDASEADAIADSCRDLVASGLPANEILILLSSRRTLERKIQDALTIRGVQFEAGRDSSFYDSDEVRAIRAFLRLLANDADYPAYRTLISLKKGIGIGTCRRIAEKAVANSLNYQALFTSPIPPGVFNKSTTVALTSVGALVATAQTWDPQDDIAQRTNDIDALLQSLIGVSGIWQKAVAVLPGGTTLEELHELLAVRDDAEEGAVLTRIYDRLGLQLPPALGGIRMMTLHSSKGLSGKVVFIPGLEEEVFPGPYRTPYAGQVEEAARMLFMGITRARATCVLSLAKRRFINGRTKNHHPSRFAAHTGGQFLARSTGLSGAEIAVIQGHIANM